MPLGGAIYRRHLLEIERFTAVIKGQQGLCDGGDGDGDDGGVAVRLHVNYR
jgi:hypothetical protein